MTRVLSSNRLNRPVETVPLPSSAPTTLVVDGNYLLKCAFHATSNNPGYNVGGRHIGALYEFMRRLREMVGRFNVTKCVVFWDGEHGGKLRHNIYPYYKANRKNKEWFRGKNQRSASQVEEEQRTQRSLESQKIRIQQYLEELFIRQTEQGMMESDDMIAYYCQQYHEQERIIIFTNDRDMCQLLKLNGVCVFIDNLKLLINRDNFDVEFPYHYSNAAVMKILLGDSSDNIKGVHLLGEQTLLDFFPELAHRPVSVQEVLEKARMLCANGIPDPTPKKPGRTKQPHVRIRNLAQGVAMRLHYGDEAPYEFGDELYKLNRQLMDLSTPMLTREARAEVDHIATCVLSPEQRGTRNLLPLMQKDTMLRYYHSDLRQFAQPFIPIALREINLFRQNDAE